MNAQQILLKDYGPLGWQTSKPMCQKYLFNNFYIGKGYTPIPDQYR